MVSESPCAEPLFASVNGRNTFWQGSETELRYLWSSPGTWMVASGVSSQRCKAEGLIEVPLAFFMFRCTRPHTRLKLSASLSSAVEAIAYGGLSVRIHNQAARVSERKGAGSTSGTRIQNPLLRHPTSPSFHAQLRHPVNCQHRDIQCDREHYHAIHHRTSSGPESGCSRPSVNKQRFSKCLAPPTCGLLPPSEG